MASGRTIKGIVVEIGGDTQGLEKALSGVNGKIRDTQSQLKDVERLLKLDPTNTELLAQKQRLLTQAINETKSKLETLKTAGEQANEALAKGEITQEQYEALQREIIATDNALKELEGQAGTAGNALGGLGGQAENTAQSFEQIAQTGEKLKNVGSAVEGVGKKILPVSAAIGGIGAIAVKTAADFDSSMSQVKAISGATAEELEDLRNKAREMGKSTKFSAKDAADAMNYMAMAGWEAKDMLNAIDGVMNLAAASGEDLAITSDIVTDAMTAFGLSVDGTTTIIKDGFEKKVANASHFADVLAATSASANTNVSKMGETFKYCAPVAGSLNFSIEEVAENIGIMAGASVKESMAGTALRTTMLNLAQGVTISGQAIGNVTIQTTEASGKMKSLNQILKECRRAFSQLSETERTANAQAIAGKNAVAGFLTLMDATPESIEKVRGAIANCDGAAAEMAATMQDNLNGEITTLKSKLSELAIVFGEILRPVVSAAVKIIGDFTDWLSGLHPAIQVIIAVIGILVAAMGPLLIAVGKAIWSIGQIMTMVPKFANAMKGIKTAVTTAATAVKTFGTGLVSHIKTGVTAASASIKAFGTTLIINIKTAVTTATTAVRAFATALLTNVKNGVTAAVTSIRAFGAALLTNIKTAVATAITSLKAFATTMLTSVKNAVTAATTAIRAFGSALMSNPIVLVIAAVVALVGAFVYLWNNCEEFRQFWIDLWEGIKKTAQDAWNGIKSFFETVWNGIKSGAETVWNGTKNFLVSTWNGIRTTAQTIWGGIKSFFGSVWDGIKSGTQTAWNETKNFLISIWNGIRTTAQTIWGGIKSFFGGVWNGIKSGTQTAWNGIKGFLISTWNGIRTTAQTIWGGIKSFFGGVWNGMKSGAQTAWNGVRTFLTSTWNNIQTTAQTIWDGTKKFFESTWDSMKTTAQTTWDNVKQFTATTWDGIKTNLQSVWTATKNNAQTIWDGMRNGVNSTVRGLASGIGNQIEKLQGNMNKTWNQIRQSTMSIWNNMSAGIKATVGGIGRKVREGFQDAVKYITSLPAKAIQWGKDFINGLIEGIKQKIDAVIEPIRKVASKIKEFLHFSRPDRGPLRDYEKWMPDFMHGLAAGIKDNQYLVEDAVKGLANSMNVSGDGTVPAQASGTINGISEMLDMMNKYLPYLAAGREMVLDTGEFVGAIAPSMDMEMHKLQLREAGR